MKTYFIAIEITDPSRSYDLGKELSKQAGTKGNPCHVLDSLWCIRSDEQVEKIYHHLKGVINPDDKFMIASINEPWLARNAKSKSECFDLND